MPHPIRIDALVLQTFDVGDADRFLVLFTRERGRMAARAYGVRKPKSRLGASLLPFAHVSVELREHGGSWTVGSVVRTPPDISDHLELASFARACEGIEMLLRLVTHEEPLSEVFDATLLFLLTVDDPQSIVRYMFSLLSLLGLLPDMRALEGMEELSDTEKSFVLGAREGKDFPALSEESVRHLRRLADTVLAPHLPAPLRAGNVGARMGE